MSTDDIVKLLLAFAVAFAIIGISYQVMRLVSKLADSVQDLRKVLQNTSTVSDMMVEDYNELRKVIRFVIKLSTSFQGNVLEPVQAAASVLSKVSKWVGRDKKPSESNFDPATGGE